MAASSATPSGTPPPPIGDSKKHHLLEIAPSAVPAQTGTGGSFFAGGLARGAPQILPAAQPVPILSRRPEIVAPEAKDGRNASDYDLIRLRGMDNPALRCSSASSRSVKKTTSRPAHRNAPSR